MIEGSPTEVAGLLKKLHGFSDIGSPALRKRSTATNSSAKATPKNLIASLIDGGFFRRPKDLASVKVSLEESGHYYPITTLSPVLFVSCAQNS